jgi:hypothetical protein
MKGNRRIREEIRRERAAFGDLAHELRVVARLVETKAFIHFGEQDATHLRKAAAELERLRSVLRHIADSTEKFSGGARGLQEIARAALKEQK